MKKKYNIALLPSHESRTITDLSNKLAPISDKYLLGKNSLPHVTLYQFDLEEDGLPKIWTKLIDAIDDKFIKLKFEKFSCITFDKKIFWASLLPNQAGELLLLHKEVASIIGLPVKNNYDPHITLISSINENYENYVNKVADNYKPIEDNFYLALGISDDIGQFTEVIYTPDSSIRFSNRFN